MELYAVGGNKNINCILLKDEMRYVGFVPFCHTHICIYRNIEIDRCVCIHILFPSYLSIAIHIYLYTRSSMCQCMCQCMHMSVYKFLSMSLTGMEMSIWHFRCWSMLFPFATRWNKRPLRKKTVPLTRIKSLPRIFPFYGEAALTAIDILRRRGTGFTRRLGFAKISIINIYDF